MVTRASDKLEHNDTAQWHQGEASAVMEAKMARECLESLMLGIGQRVQPMLCAHIFLAYISNIYYAS